MTNNNNDENTGYNGYTNYETWCLNLWLNNDENTYETITRIANMKLDIYDRVQILKDLIQEENPLRDNNSIYSDLLMSALQSIDYYEIIRANETDQEEEEEIEEEED